MLFTEKELEHRITETVQRLAKKHHISDDATEALMQELTFALLRFYTLALLKDARKWQRLRPILLDTSEKHVILEFRVPRRVWKRLRRKRVPESYNWRILQNWIREFDVLECHWGVTPETSTLRGAKQYKFNPHTYEILDAALVR